jgi:hypothetical protein
MSHLLEVYPEKVAHLNRDAFGRIIGSLEFGLRNQARASHVAAFTTLLCCHSIGRIHFRLAKFQFSSAKLQACLTFA